MDKLLASPMLNIIRSRSRRKSKIEKFDDSPDSGLDSAGSINKYEFECRASSILELICMIS